MKELPLHELMKLQIAEVSAATEEEPGLSAIPEDEIAAEEGSGTGGEYSAHAHAVSCQLLYTLGRELVGQLRNQRPTAAGRQAFNT